MKSSAGKAVRKWTFGVSACDLRTIAIALAVAGAVSPAQAYLTATRIPLPQPRPAEAPSSEPPAQAPAEEDKAAAAPKPAEPAPPQPSACRLALTDQIAVAPSVPDIKGPGACGGPDMVHLEAVVLADGSRVPLKPGGTMRCSMASAVADWIRADMAPLAASLGTKLVELDNFDSFDCRGRNRVAGAKLSEHGRANALDIRGLKLGNGTSIALTERATPRAWREKVLLSVCSRFTTVLGPGSDGYHEDHIHLDLAERRGNYRICQWDVWDDWPRIAPLMPAVRPDEAPPRQVAEREAPAAASSEPAAAPAPSPEARPEQPDGKPDAQAEAKPKAKSDAKAKSDIKAKRPRRQRAQAPFPLNLVR